MVLHCLSLMTCDVEDFFFYDCQPFICLLFKSVCYAFCLFFIGVIGFNFSFLDSEFANIFSHSLGYLLSLLTVSLAVQKLRSLIRSYLSILAFVANAFDVLVMQSLPMSMS